MLYLLQVTVYSALLFLVYLAVLSNRASHTWNRAYLLACAALPLVIPFIRLPALYNNAIAANSIINILLPQVTISAAGKPAHTGWAMVLFIIYLVVSAALLLRIMVQYLSLKQLIRHSSCKQMGKATLVRANDMAPSSFLHYIFLPGGETNTVQFDHEMAHVRLRHSMDILFLRVLQAICWPNIALHLISKELRIVHEFQADACAAKDKKLYTTALLNNTFHTNRFTLSHTFFHHPLKRRIMMLHRSPLSRTGMRILMLKTGSLAALLLTGAIWLQSCTHTQEPATQTSEAAMEQPAAKQAEKSQTANEEVLESAEKMPEPLFDLNQYLVASLKYPEDARKKGISGRVMVKFVVDEQGNVRDAITTGKEENGDLCAEAVRVVAHMPKWKPAETNGKQVAVYMMLPVNFKL